MIKIRVDLGNSWKGRGVRRHLNVRGVCRVCALVVVVLLLGGAAVTFGARAQVTSVSNYKHLLLVYPNTNVSYIENGVLRTFSGNMSRSHVTIVTDAFRNFPNLIRNASNNLVSSTYDVVEVSRPTAKISVYSGDYFWLSSSDIDQDLKQYAPAGRYDSVHVIWYSGSVKTYFGMGGVFINSGTATFDSIVAGESWWWTGIGEAYGEPFLHEWLHGVCRYYAGLGFPMPDYDADGADEHGYSKSATDGWMPYYRDLMQGKVWESRLSRYTGITLEAWSRPTPSGSSSQGTQGSQLWSRSFGRAGDEGAASVVQTGDGGFAVAGYTNSSGAGGYDFWLVRTDSSGNQLWNRTYGGIRDEWAACVVLTSDGGFALAGNTYSSGAGGNDFWLVRTDSSGNLLWSKTYGGTSFDCAYSLVLTSDGGFALAGYTYSYGAGSGDVWLVKTDSGGNQQWTRTFGGTKDDQALSLVQTSDGGYALAGYTYSYGAGGQDIWLVRTTSAGNLVWNKTYREIGDDIARSVVLTSDGGFGLACTLAGGDYWLIKTDSVGNQAWVRTYGGSNTDWAYSVAQTQDGGYALLGFSGSYGSGGDFWLIKTDSTGNQLWNKVYGGEAYELGISLVQTSDGGYALTGNTNSFGGGGSDFWLVRVSADAVVPEFGVWVFLSIFLVLTLVLSLIRARDKHDESRQNYYHKF